MLHEGEPGAAELAERLEESGVAVERLRLPWAADPRAFARLVRIVRRVEPAILHTHLVHADFHGLVAGRLARVPVLVSTKHGFNPFRSGRAFAAVDRGVARLADVHIAISAGLARYLSASEGFDSESFEVVHYGIEAGPPPPPLPGAPRLAVVGRLIPIKGHDVLLRAVAVAREALPDVTLEIAGDGPLEPELRASVARLGLGDVVSFLGRVAPARPVLLKSARLPEPPRLSSVRPPSSAPFFLGQPLVIASLFVAVAGGVDPTHGARVPAALFGLVLGDPAMGAEARRTADGWGGMQAFDQVEHVRRLAQAAGERGVQVQDVA